MDYDATEIPRTYVLLIKANAFGAQVVLFTTSPNKIADAQRLGAHDVVLSNDADDMLKHAASFNFILDTVSAQHDLNP